MDFPEGTVQKLREMRLGVMAEAFAAQLEDVQFRTISFEDRFAVLVDSGAPGRATGPHGSSTTTVLYPHHISLSSALWR